MNSLSRIAVLAIASLSIVVADACSHPPPPPPPAPAPPPPPGPTPAQLAATQRAKDSADSVARAREAQRVKDSTDAANRAKAAAALAAEQKRISDAAKAAADAAAMRAALVEVVHFDYDKSELRDDTKATLDAKIPILRTNSAVMIRITGNTDERGSKQYNFELGMRRAKSAKQYLVDRGIAESRIDIVSKGKDNPLPGCEQKNETCWGPNRRDEFEITAGGNMLIKP